MVFRVLLIFPSEVTSHQLSLAQLLMEELRLHLHWLEQLKQLWPVRPGFLLWGHLLISLGF